MGHDETPSSSARIRALPGPGSKLGAYTVVGTLGRGGMGLVLHVRDGSGRDLALKLLMRQADSVRVLERFRREAQVTASLRHPGIIGVHDTGTAAGWPFITYELVPEGRTLEGVFAQGDTQASTRLVLGVAEALGYAHAKGVIHRDLKASNVLVSPEGQVRVADFGLAQAIGLERLTMTGALVGTPPAMAPEQITGDRDHYGPHTDVWALGVLLYEALTGRGPFEAQTLVELSARICAAEPTPPRSLNTRLTPAVEAVCLKALEKVPEQRYPEASAFAADLRAALVEGTAGALSTRRTRIAAVAVVVVLLSAVAFAGVAALTSQSASPTPTVSSPPVNLAEARRVERLLRLLDRTLGSLGEVRNPQEALTRLDPELLALPAAQERLLAAQQEWGSALHASLDREELDPDLMASQARVLAALVGPCGTSFPRADEAADKLLAIGDAAEARWENFPEILTLFGEAGARARDRLAGDRLFVLFEFELATQRLTPEWVRRALPGLARLDVGFRSGLHLQELRWAKAASPEGADPWERSVRLRIQCERNVARGKVQMAREELQRLWADPPAGLDLGVVHRAELAFIASLDLEAAKRLEIVDEGLALDPDSTALYLSRSQALSQLGRFPEALAALEATETSWEANRFGDRHTAPAQWTEIARARLGLAAARGDRETFAALLEEQTRGDESARRQVLRWVRKIYPWVREAYPAGE